MPVTVKTFASSARRPRRWRPTAARAISAAARWSCAPSTRAILDRDARARHRSGAVPDRRRRARASRSAPASPWRRFWPSAISPSCTRRARRSAGRPCAPWRPSAAICSRPHPMAISPSRCWRSTPPCRSRAATARATCRSRNSCDRRERRSGALVLAVSCRGRRAPTRSAIARSRASSRRAFRCSRSPRICRVSGGRVSRRAHRLRRDGADADSRKGRRARAGRTLLDEPAIAPRAAAAAEGISPADRCARQRLVSPRDRRRSSAPPAARRPGVKQLMAKTPSSFVTTAATSPCSSTAASTCSSRCAR